MKGDPVKPSVLLAVGALLQREVDLDELLDKIVHRIAEAVSADRGTIYLVDPEAGELFSRAAHLPELKQIRLKIGQGIAGTVAATGISMNLPAADADRRFFKEIGGEAPEFAKIGMMKLNGAAQAAIED